LQAAGTRASALLAPISPLRSRALPGLSTACHSHRLKHASSTSMPRSGAQARRTCRSLDLSRLCSKRPPSKSN